VEVQNSETNDETTHHVSLAQSELLETTENLVDTSSHMTKSFMKLMKFISEAVQISQYTHKIKSFSET
jgi:hypothetical protein